MPSLGEVNALVVPIDFANYPSSTQEYTISDLNKVFFGDSEETDWESVSSYYYKSSYGKLNISGDVLNWYRASRNHSYYNSFEDGSGVDLLIKESLQYHVTYNGLDTSKYDSDNDGYIDAIYFIYTASVDYDSYDTIWWAFQSDYEKADKFGNKRVGKYVFAGLDFLNEVQGAHLDATTYIHETGHLMGLDDYYDYDDSVGPDGGLGYSDMMEYNVGDHNSLSKILLGWVTPKVVIGNSNLTISSLINHEDIILVTNEWHNSLFDEYILIDVYTPSGINVEQYEAYDEDTCESNPYNQYCDSYLPPFTISGIRMYHVDATLGGGSDIGYYSTLFAYNNSTTSRKLIKLIEADGKRDIESNANYPYAEDDDLFIDGDSFNLTIWNNYRLYSNQYLKYIVNYEMIDAITFEVNLQVK